MRWLPNLSLLSPKDGAELRQMLDWCLAQPQPAVVWLPQAIDVPLPSPDSAALVRGQAERFVDGRDVALVAWGPWVKVASMAAELLEPYGINASVINARFGHPLADDWIDQALEQSLCVVLLDDAPRPGGVSSWILEHLLRCGLTRPVSVVMPHDRFDGQSPHDLHKQCALEVVNRCRWLAEPVDAGGQDSQWPDTLIAPAEARNLGGWFGTHRLDVPERHDDHRQVLTYQFSPFIEHWVRQYEKVGARDVYLWRWCLRGLELTTLSCVAPRLRSSLVESKLLAIMYNVMLDDIADQNTDEDFLNELAKIISGVQPRDFSRFSPQQQAYARFTCELWKTFESRLKCLPCHKEYEELLAYDHRQILNTMAYASLINRYPAMLNVEENDMYLSHNMQMMIFGTMDLMGSPTFDRRELGLVREVTWHSQCMGRIGNLITTWQREIVHRDFTSGVFASALRRGDLTLEQLRTASPQDIETAIRRGGHEWGYLKKWADHYRSIEALQHCIHSVDVGALLVGLQRLMHLELSSRGFK